MGILDLSGADTSGFDAADAGSYDCTVFEIEMTETGGSGKLPAGVPMIKVQFQSQDEERYSGRFFSNYPLPTEEQSPKGWKFQQGSFVKFLTALGYDEQKLKTKGFDPKNLEELVGKACVVRVSKEWYVPKGASEEDGYFTNPVKGVKPEGSPTGSVPSDDLL